MATDSPRKPIDTPLHIAINSRLLFNSKQEAEDFLGIQLKNLKSPKNMRAHLDLLDAKSEEDAMIDLSTLVDLYSGALEKFRLDNGLKSVARQTDRRTREEIRKRLAVRLFLWTYLGQTSDGRDKALNHDDDKGRFPNDSFRPYCQEPGGEESIDVCFTILLNWAIVSPNGSKTEDYPSDHTRSDRMLELLTTIRNEMPQVGIFEAGGLPAIEVAIKEILYCKANDIYPSSARYWLMLQQVAMAALASAAPDTLDAAGLTTYGLRLPGIWKDNEDGGVKRFWIFPANYHFAFCYERTSAGDWFLNPYEFSAYTTDITSDDCDSDYLVVAEASHSQTIIANGGCGSNADGIAYARFKRTLDSDCNPTVLNLLPMKPTLPPPLPWDRFDRLSPHDHLFKEALEVVRNPQYRAYGYNCLINIVNNIVGVDRDYIYLYDYPLEVVPFAIPADAKSTDPALKFTYKAGEDNDGKDNDGKDNDSKNFRHLNLTDIAASGLPVYAIPRQPRCIDKSKASPDFLDRLLYAMGNTSNDDSVTIYHFGSDDDHTIIFFTSFSVGVSVSRLKKLLGLRKDASLVAPLAKQPCF
ncbi:MAG: hypothetical protein K2G35_05550 [Duncaniella sp.]|nr:hypothetical protein [Duncaniella sp.]